MDLLICPTFATDMVVYLALFSGETIWSKSILRIRSSTVRSFYIYFCIYNTLLDIFELIEYILSRVHAYIYVTLLFRPSIHPLVRITAPAHPYATDAVVHTALFETDIKPCSMLPPRPIGKQQLLGLKKISNRLKKCNQRHNWWQMSRGINCRHLEYSTINHSGTNLLFLNLLLFGQRPR